jgi:2'-hydroxyisoflavone reductase
LRILVIGGTRFVGRHFVESALRAGDQVTVFHRGRTGADLFGSAEHLFGDRDADLTALGGDQRWDATVDVCGYFPDQVSRLADVLGERAGRYLFVSSISAYADPPPGAATCWRPARRTRPPR